MMRPHVAAHRLAAAPRALACRLQPDARRRRAAGFVTGFGASVLLFAAAVTQLIATA